MLYLMEEWKMQRMQVYCSSRKMKIEGICIYNDKDVMIDIIHLHQSSAGRSCRRKRARACLASWHQLYAKDLHPDGTATPSDVQKIGISTMYPTCTSAGSTGSRCTKEQNEKNGKCDVIKIKPTCTKRGTKITIASMPAIYLWTPTADRGYWQQHSTGHHVLRCTL